MCTALFSIYESSEKIWFEPWYATSHHISPEENKYFHWLYKLNNFDCLEQLFKLKFQKEIVFYNTKLLRQSLTICVWIFFFFLQFQYRLVYECIAMYLQCGITVVSAVKFPGVASRLAVKDPRTRMLGFEKEFQVQVQGLKFILISRWLLVYKLVVMFHCLILMIM